MGRWEDVPGGKMSRERSAYWALGGWEMRLEEREVPLRPAFGLEELLASHGLMRALHLEMASLARASEMQAASA